MKNTYPPLGGICGKAIQNNLCKGCSKLEIEEFKGQEKCDLVQDSIKKIKQILGIGEQMKL